MRARRVSVGMSSSLRSSNTVRMLSPSPVGNPAAEKALGHVGLEVRENVDVACAVKIRAVPNINAQFMAEAHGNRTRKK